MNRSVFKFPSPAQPMQFDGERYTSGIEGPIQREHYHRYLFALRYCEDKHVLDVASGEGYGSSLLGQVARSVTGVDIDPKTVDFANKNYMSERVSFRRGDAAKLPIEDQSVDVVVSFETIEHFANQTDFVMEIDRVLRPGGLVIMSSPNREIYSELNNYQNPFHVHELNRQEFVDLLGPCFPHIRMLEQGAVVGSLILPLPGEQSDNVEGFTTRDGQLYERLTGLPGAPYFIAIAARSPIPAPHQSVLHADFFHEQIERRFIEIENGREEQAVAHSQRAQQKAAEEASLREEMTARHAEQIAQTQAALHAHYAQQGAQVEASLREEIAAQHAVISKVQEQLLRRLASTRTALEAKLPRELRGIARFIHKQTRRLVREYRALASSPIFDRDWYLENNPDVAAAGYNPVLHYLLHGATEERQPGPLFDSRRYTLVNPDVAAAQMNPLLHFIRCGAYEGRPLGQEAPPPPLTPSMASTSPVDRDWYLENNPDVAAAGYDPLVHYALHGAAEGRRPGPLFNASEHSLVSSDVATPQLNPLHPPTAPAETAAIEEAEPSSRTCALSLSRAVGAARRWLPSFEMRNPSFDAAFLAPLYAAAGRSGDPLSVWRNLSSMGAIPPTNREAAEAMAAAVRRSSLFDAQFYGARLPKGVDPALHYVVIGEILEWAPSELFDPQFYLARNPDVKAANVSPLMHFQEHGKAEGRRGVPFAQRLTFAPLGDERQPILVICHEASRTGAPILGWNLIRDLRKKGPIVTLLMRGGALEEDFAAASDVIVGPLKNEEWHPIEFAFIAERLVQTYKPLYAVANSIVTSPMVQPLGALGVADCRARARVCFLYASPWLDAPDLRLGDPYRLSRASRGGFVL